jgi:hypothetical protein
MPSESTRRTGRGSIRNLRGSNQRVLKWLLDGDPAIRWQVHRDLLDSPARTIVAERARVAREGWGRRLLELQGPDGRWMATHGPREYRGLYIPKWTSTTYTMRLLSRLGAPAGDRRLLAGCRALVDGAEWFPSGGLGFFASRRSAEHCVSAMILAILETFEADTDARTRLDRFLCAAQLRDGGWNCIEHAQHSSFNTTTAALEALALRAPSARRAEALQRGREFLLAHRLYRSHRTGRIVKPQFTALRWPIGWETDVLRELDLLVDSGAPYDARLDDAVERIVRRRRADGRWTCTRFQPGAVHFQLEPAGKPSRWVTLRALRVLRWRDRN